MMMKTKRLFGRIGLAIAVCTFGVATDGVWAQAPIEVELNAHAGRMWVPATAANGETLRLVVSTGSTTTVLTESAAARISGAVMMSDVEVKLDGMVTTPDHQFNLSGEQFDGQVTVNTLSDFNMLVDVPGGRMLLKPIGPPVSWEDEGYQLTGPTRLRVYHGVVLSLDVRLSGTEIPAMLELGTPRLMANPAGVEAGAFTDSAAPNLQIGEQHWTDLPGGLSDHPIIERFSPNGDAFVIVGGVIAMDCAIAISWVRSEVRTCQR